jgi:hypothetical protein
MSETKLRETTATERHMVREMRKMRFTANGKPFQAASEMTRQQLRSVGRRSALEAINRQFGPEPRANRRRMMLAIAGKKWRAGWLMNEAAF